MKTVIVDRADIEIAIKNSQLKIGANGVPLRLMEMLVLAHDVSLSSSLLLKLSRENIAVLMLSKNSKDFALTLPQVAKNSELKIAQYNGLENRLGLAKYFVLEKVRTHTEHLKSMGVIVDADQWQSNISSAKDIDALLGFEGSFARLFFEHFF